MQQKPPFGEFFMLLGSEKVLRNVLFLSRLTLSMNTDKQTLIGGALVLLLLIGVGWYVMTKNTGGAKPEVTQNATSTEGSVSRFVGPIAQDVSTPAPSLERPIPETSDI